MEYSMKIRFIFASGYRIWEYPSIGINIFMKRLLAGRTFIMGLQHAVESLSQNAGGSEDRCRWNSDRVEERHTICFPKQSQTDNG